MYWIAFAKTTQTFYSYSYLSSSWWCYTWPNKWPGPGPQSRWSCLRDVWLWRMNAAADWRRSGSLRCELLQSRGQRIHHVTPAPTPATSQCTNRGASHTDIYMGGMVVMNMVFTIFTCQIIRTEWWFCYYHGFSFHNRRLQIQTRKSQDMLPLHALTSWDPWYHYNLCQ